MFQEWGEKNANLHINPVIVGENVSAKRCETVPLSDDVYLELVNI